jgi:hypothetical protein
MDIVRQIEELFDLHGHKRDDDLAKHPARMTPSLVCYPMLVEAVRQRPEEAVRMAIGANNIA